MEVRSKRILKNDESECLFCQLVQVQIGLGNSLQLSKTELGIVLEVNNGDAMVGSWSAHLIGCVVPFLFINIEFED